MFLFEEAPEFFLQNAGIFKQSGPQGLYLPLTLLAWRWIDVGASGHGFVNRHEILIPFHHHA